MSLADFAASLGKASVWDDAIWPEFLNCSIGIVVDAFEMMLQRASWTQEWHETQFTAALYLCMRRVHASSDPRLPIELHHEKQLLNEERVLSGLDLPEGSPRVELYVRYVSMPLETYLACEAKMLTTKSVSHRRPQASIDAYVNEGMRRFVEGRYAPNVNVGIMVGLVLIGPIGTIAARIATAVVTERLACKNNLTASPSPACVGHYYSAHPRVKSQDIRLEHLLLPFPLVTAPSGSRRPRSSKSRPPARSKHRGPSATLF